MEIRVNWRIRHVFARRRAGFSVTPGDRNRDVGRTGAVTQAADGQTNLFTPD